MSREIKFRAWYKHDLKAGIFNKFESERVEGRYYKMVLPNGDRHPYTYDIGTVLCDDDWLVEQYTGLKDVKEVEIYEGDILEYTIDFSDVGGDVHTRRIVASLELDKIHDVLVYLTHGAVLEIIGNIHENPELIKEEDGNE